MKSFSFYKGVGLAATACAGVMATGRLYGILRARRDRRDYPSPGTMVDVGGHSLHVLRMGEPGEGPTVLFEAGMASPLECWTWVQREVSAWAPTISYERAGNGRSEQGPQPRTAARSTAELRGALEAIGCPGPYVLVAHSYGGLLVRDFAQRHPDEVAGMVFVDVTHPDELVRSPRQASGVEQVEGNLRDSLQQATWGLRYLTATPEKTKLDGLPPYERASAMAVTCTPQMWSGALAEFLDWQHHVIDEVRDSKLPHGVPLVVLTAEGAIEDDPVHLDLQRELCGLSTNSDHRVIKGADHFTILTDMGAAAQVAQAIRDVTTAVRDGVPLAAASDSSVLNG